MTIALPEIPAKVIDFIGLCDGCDFCHAQLRGHLLFLGKSIIMVSNWVSYLIIFVIIAHFVAGFAFLVKKLSGPARESSEEEQMEG